MAAPLHECSSSQGGMGILAACPENGSVSATSIITIVVVFLVLALVGFGIWKWVQSRRY